jgi:hypothetical protein
MKITMHPTTIISSAPLEREKRTRRIVSIRERIYVISRGGTSPRIAGANPTV